MDFDDFGGSLPGRPLSQPDKAAAVLLAMGKQVAGRLLKYFTQHELQVIIASAQTLRAIPPDELASIVSEFEDLLPRAPASWIMPRRSRTSSKPA